MTLKLKPTGAYTLLRITTTDHILAVSLERIQGFIDIDHERPPSPSRSPPAAWPTSGDLHVQNLCARYSHGGPNILHDISFDVKSGERLAIGENLLLHGFPVEILWPTTLVGRTGSGKVVRSLMLVECHANEWIELSRLSTTEGYHH